MKIFLMGILVVLGLSACASKSTGHDGSYDQANRASEKAQMQLQRDVK